MPLSLADAQAIEAVKRVSARSAAVVHQEMQRGLASLATVATTAPLLGLLASVLSISNSFPACGAERSACMAAVFERLAESFTPAALGLLIAVPALWCYRYLRGEMEAFKTEMENASLDLVNCLVLHLARPSRFEP